MISYIRPDFSFNEIWRTFIFRKKIAAKSLKKLKRIGIRSLYIREKQRYCLSSFLQDMEWVGENILIPAYTCASVANAIRISGNTPLFYDVTDDFQVDLNSLKVEAEKGIKAIIISDVYGIKMDISSYISTISKKPLIIADFAHYESFEFNINDRDYVDVVMFSSAYYKPISSSGIGVLAIVSNRIEIEDSIQINDSFISSIIGAIKICLISFILRSTILKYIYHFVVQKDKVCFEKVKPAPLISLAQINKFFTLNKDRNALNSLYYENFNTLNPIQPGNNSKTYFSIIVDETKRKELHSYCLKRGILLGNIFGRIAGNGNNNCPKAIYLSKRVLNLPYLRDISPYEQKKIILTVLDALRNV